MIKPMSSDRERILVVESDPGISELVVRQTLLPLGYTVQLVGEASTAIQETIRFSPDVIIADLNLPGLSGKDLLVALSSQGLDIPIIVLADEVKEGDIIDSFRLGAADFVTWPLGEAELAAVVERVLTQVRASREKDLLARQLNQANQELQRRVKELTTIFAVGKAVTSTRDLHNLFDRIVEGAVFVSEAEAGWLLFRDEVSKNFVLSAARNLPAGIAAQMNQPWEDGLSSLVALSAEPLSIHGESLKRFKISAFGQSALVVPVKVKHDVLASLVVVRKTAQPFSSSSQALLEAVADYASIAIINARLFRALNDRIRSSQQVVDSALINERIGSEILIRANLTLKDALAGMQAGLGHITEYIERNPNTELPSPFSQVRPAMARFEAVVQFISHATSVQMSPDPLPADLNELVRQSVLRFQPIVQSRKISLLTELSPRPLIINANPTRISWALDGLVYDAIRNNRPGVQIEIRVTRTVDSLAQLTIQDRGRNIHLNNLESLFNESKISGSDPVDPVFSGIGISLKLVQEIVQASNGKIWVNSEAGKGSVFFILLPVGKV
jgi:signal transduction histidine kinase